MSGDRVGKGDKLQRVIEGIAGWDKPFTKIHHGAQTLVPLSEVAEFIDAVTQRSREMLPLLRAGQKVRDDFRDETFGIIASIEAWDDALAALERER